MTMIIAGLLRFIGTLLFFVVLLAVSTFVASKVTDLMISKWLDNRWVVKYFALAEKCIARVDKRLAGISKWYRTIFPDRDHDESRGHF
jgi:hypothetical protein